MKRLILLTFLFVVACGKSSGKMSILDRSNCKLPCWNGIIAGQTTGGELLKTLENLSDVDPESIENTNQRWDIFDNQIFFSFRRGGIFSQHPRIDGEVRILNDTVSDLIICGEINTSIGQLMDGLGEPETIISGNDLGGGRTVIFTSHRNGISYWYTAKLSDLELTPDTQMDCIKMFDPLLYEQMLEAGLFSAGYYNAEETRRVWYSWDGYGNLDEKYPPRQP